jgi:hypothetical protein
MKQLITTFILTAIVLGVTGWGAWCSKRIADEIMKPKKIKRSTRATLPR